MEQNSTARPCPKDRQVGPNLSVKRGQVSLSKPTANLSHETHQILEKDGYRALLSVDAGRVELRSRRGTQMPSAFSEIVDGAARLPDATAVDGELVVWEGEGLAFERLQHRLQRRGAGAVRAGEWPTHFVAFKVRRSSNLRGCLWSTPS
ncbi:hypothetical protein [Streptomyces sp. NBC_00996]|uniref:ATP-dependent DNA ligase n=1 Tax=Streptomyces sp. NBC_00996 TaxID=2903710 RepID=UPI00386EBB88|nr:hypothetical protein OG390_01010 [Streptomyces sp. NBC_00996]